MLKDELDVEIKAKKEPVVEAETVDEEDQSLVAVGEENHIVKQEPEVDLSGIVDGEPDEDNIVQGNPINLDTEEQNAVDIVAQEVDKIAASEEQSTSLLNSLTEVD